MLRMSCTSGYYSENFSIKVMRVRLSRTQKYSFFQSYVSIDQGSAWSNSLLLLIALY